MKITIGSRGSDLALWQAYHVRDRLTELGAEVEIKIIKTQGDRIQHLSFDKMEGKGFFTKEIEAALLEGEIDLAVHSHKDLETTSPQGLVIAAVSEREDPSELILVRKESVDVNLALDFKKGAVVGTSSARRKSQLLSIRPDIEIKDLRGNVPTRINKLRNGDYDAIMAAYAGVARLELNLDDLHVLKPNPREFIPAPAQGVLGLQVRASDQGIFDFVHQLNSKEIENRIAIERKVLRLFNGGCQLPLGVYCELNQDGYKVWSAMAEAWNAPVHRDYIESKSGEDLADEIVQRLKKKVTEK